MVGRPWLHGRLAGESDSRLLSPGLICVEATKVANIIYILVSTKAQVLVLFSSFYRPSNSEGLLESIDAAKTNPGTVVGNGFPEGGRNPLVI